MVHKRSQPIPPPPPEADAPADGLAPEGSAPAPDTAAADLEALRDRHLRLAAEYDNFRRRVARERGETWMRAQAELVARLADALDDLARVAHVNPDDTDAKTMQEGIEFVERKLWKELEAAGVTRIDETGVPFDPHVHEAVTTQPASDPAQDHTVGQVLQTGYRLRDVLLRPARVVVLTWQGE